MGEIHTQRLTCFFMNNLLEIMILWWMGTICILIHMSKSITGMTVNILFWAKIDLDAMYL